ncbi:MAG: polysaccharide biosynthesis tyrosine autokinase [Candidatus Promineifilaceae bacterium]|jgi:capsular exopolysaccharide synthesis family protein
MELKKYLSIIWRRKVVILITAVLTTVVVLTGITYYPTSYEAIATLRVASSRNEDVTYEEMLYVDRLTRTFARVASSSAMVEEVRHRLNLSESPIIEAEVLPNTELIEILVEHQDPEIAQKAAELLVEMVIGESEHLGSKYNPLSVVENITTSQKTVLTPPLILFLGTFMGLVGGMGLAFLFENLDKTLYEEKQIEAASNLPTLGKIPKVGSNKTILSAGHSPCHLTQSFHILRGNILLQSNGNSLRSLLIVSADPKEGKSTIVANLACSMAQAGKKVVVIDGDLRRPKQHNIFEVSNDIGLSDYLGNNLELEQVLQTSDSGIDVITSGPLPADPISLLNNEKVSAMMSDLTNQYDYVLVDAPAVLGVPDAKLFASQVDGLILVVNRAKTSEEAVQLAISTMKEMQAHPIGVVINRAEFKDGYYYYTHTSKME